MNNYLKKLQIECFLLDHETNAGKRSNFKFTDKLTLYITGIPPGENVPLYLHWQIHQYTMIYISDLAMFASRP